MDRASSIARWFAGADPVEAALPELSVLFQPIVDVSAGRRLQAVELLVRGPIESPLEDPSALLEYARFRGAEVRVDRACAEAAVAAGARAPVPRVAINVHAMTLSRDPDFLAFLAGLLARHELLPQQLSVEVLAPHHFTPALFDALEGLRALGIGIAIDDVGLDNADYKALVDCRADLLKLDASMCGALSDQELRNLMLDSIVGLAKASGARCVATGVDSPEDLDRVSAHGITLVQGLFVGEGSSVAALSRAGLVGERGLRTIA